MIRVLLCGACSVERLNSCFPADPAPVHTQLPGIQHVLVSQQHQLELQTAPAVATTTAVAAGVLRPQCNGFMTATPTSHAPLLLLLQAMSSNYFLWIIAIVAVLAVLSKLTGAI